MRIIEIATLENGAHRNQVGNFKTIPEGWAVIPDGMTVPDTFPFVSLTVADGVVTSMTAGIVPTPSPEPGPTMEERVTALETALAQTDETAIELYEAQVAQEEVNAAQDDALIELYEMIGG